LSAEPLDKISSELLNALDKLTNDVNRKVLQILLESGETDVRKLHSLFEEHRGVSYGSFVSKLRLMEKDNLVICTITEDGRSVDTVKLSTFGDILLRGLLVAQKLLETKN